MKFKMIATGQADINNRKFSWSEGEIINLSEFEASVLQRGGYVGDEVKAKRGKKNG